MSGEKIQRPLSPHLQVYKLPYNATMSIVGRGVGIGLSVAVSVIFICLIAAAWYPPVFEHIMAFLHFPLIGYLMFPVAFIVFFYLGNGVRHVLWDFVIGVHHKTGFMTGHITLIVSALLTLLLVVISFQNPQSVLNKESVSIESPLKGHSNGK